MTGLPRSALMKKVRQSQAGVVERPPGVELETTAEIPSREVTVGVQTPAVFRVEDIVDSRSADLEAQGVVGPAFVDAVREVFDGTDLMHNQRKVAQLVQVRAEISEHWAGMRDRFLAIGRALLALDGALTRLESERLRAGTSRLFPFTAGIASQLRQVARSVDSGRLAIDDCPGSYSAAYQLVQLNEEQFARAKDEGLIRPDVSRSALIEFRRRCDSHEVRDVGRPQERKRRLVAKEASLKKQLEAVRAEIAEVDKQIAAGRVGRGSGGRVSENQA